MTIPSALPSQDELRRLFHYDEVLGFIVRKARDDVPAHIRNRFAGKRAGYRSARGYVQVCVHGKLFTAHRIIWKMAYGDEPPVIDHRDGNPSNNRIENLRAATQAQNIANSTSRRSGLSRGVKRTPAGRFAAEITADGSRRYLGTFATENEAAAAYRAAASAAFGPFARHMRD